VYIRLYILPRRSRAMMSGFMPLAGLKLPGT
jgi:hypothetical protein